MRRPASRRITTTSRRRRADRTILVGRAVRRHGHVAPDDAVHHRHGRHVRRVRRLDRVCRCGSVARTSSCMTPDQRFPQGADACTAQQADFAITQCAARRRPASATIVNRPSGTDLTPQIPWGRFELRLRPLPLVAQSGDGTAQNGKFAFFTLAEMNLLEAEGRSAMATSPQRRR